MPKKTRREKLRAARRPMSLPTVSAPQTSTQLASGAVRASAGTVSRPAPIETQYDYRYVYSDLRRIAFLAGTFIAVLIALSFVIR